MCNAAQATWYKPIINAFDQPANYTAKEGGDQEVAITDRLNLYKCPIFYPKSEIGCLEFFNVLI